jgi:uncharacterized lipoprotein YbaY
MVYEGQVKNGVVVLDDLVALPEGAKVRVELAERRLEPSPMDEQAKTLGEKLMKFAGKAVGLPPDAARNHDHYLYGTPK